MILRDEKNSKIVKCSKFIDFVNRAILFKVRRSRDKKKNARCSVEADDKGSSVILFMTVITKFL